MDFVKNFGSIETLAYTLMSILGIVLMVTTYMYIQKLERIACQCAEHPYRKFIKNYILFAIGFLVVTTFVPPAVADKLFGANFAVVYKLIQVLWFRHSDFLHLCSTLRSLSSKGKMQMLRRCPS